jgi:hypothetical protein
MNYNIKNIDDTNNVYRNERNIFQGFPAYSERPIQLNALKMWLFIVIIVTVVYVLYRSSNPIPIMTDTQRNMLNATTPLHPPPLTNFRT